MQRSGDELIAIARATYYGPDVALVADAEEQVVRPRNYIDPRGCSAIRITPEGGWEEGWWSPDRAFRLI